MNKFHQIPTDQFVPVSHDNSYLFTHYDKVANFLAFNLNRNYKNILAKPVQNGYVFDWFSSYEGLVNIKECNKAETDAGLIKYWDFIEIVKAKIAELSNSYDDDRNNWANLLTKVFNQQDNFIFSNGKDISIVWGWKFNNNEIYKPNLIDKSSRPTFQVTKVETPLSSNELDDINGEEIKSTVEENIPFDESREKLDKTLDGKDSIIAERLHQKYGFLEFLKWFAARFWWLLWLITFLVAIVFFIKAYNVNA